MNCVLQTCCFINFFRFSFDNTIINGKHCKNTVILFSNHKFFLLFTKLTKEGILSSVGLEQQPSKLWVAGSIPAEYKKCFFFGTFYKN